MRHFNLMISITLLLTLVSCEDEITKCEDTFKNDYNSLQQSFANIYSPQTTLDDFDEFKKSVTSFTEKYPEKCTVNGQTYDVVSELEQFISDSDINLVLSPKVIYGKDDRLDISSSTDPRHQKWATAVAVQIAGSEIDSDGKLPNTTIKDSLNLCASEEFSDQINPGRCSGFLVGPKTLVTAGHCVEDMNDCSENKWVFGFHAGVSKLSQSQIYSCDKIISQKLDSSTNADFAVIELDREVVNSTPLTFRTEGKANVGDKITVMGHPSGLPMKVAAGASVRSNSAEWFFVGNLDTFGGNSGSPVFNTSTGVVEGILVRGETDYTWSTDNNGKSCRVVYRCKDDECRGEDVTKITKVTGLPKVVSAAEILAEFYEGSKLSYKNTGIAFKVQVKPGAEKYLAGTKFLDLCALHTATNNDPKNWLASKVVNCKNDQQELIQVIEIFKD